MLICRSKITVPESRSCCQFKPRIIGERRYSWFGCG